MAARKKEVNLVLESVRQNGVVNGVEELVLQTNAGTIKARYHEARGAEAALSSQTYGTGLADELSPRPLLLMHGTDDEILPDRCSQQIYERANEPKEIRLYKGCRHGLDECRPQIDTDLLNWLSSKLH